MPDGYPIAPRWIRPTLTASLTATECLLASESAENASASLLRWNVVSMPGIRWVRWGGRGLELRLPRVVVWSLGTDQTLATGGGRPTSVHRHRSRVVWLSPDEVQYSSSTAPDLCLQTSVWHGGRCALCHTEVCRHRSKHSANGAAPHIHQLEVSEMKNLPCGFPSQA